MPPDTSHPLTLAVVAVLGPILTIACTHGVPALLSLWKQRSADQVVQADLASKGYVFVIAELKQQITDLKADVACQEKAYEVLAQKERDCAVAQAKMQFQIDVLLEFKLRHGGSDAKPSGPKTEGT